MRVVLDTNILVSASWKPAGLESEVVNLANSGRIVACVSAETLAEYRDVLSRRKLASVRSRASEVLAKFEDTALVVETAAPITASVDDDDNRFLECAAAAGAEYLITGNLRHYPAEWTGANGTTRIVNARTFLSHVCGPDISPATVEA